MTDWTPVEEALPKDCTDVEFKDRDGSIYQGSFFANEEDGEACFCIHGGEDDPMPPVDNVTEWRLTF